jgi:hypothetical protein
MYTIFEKVSLGSLLYSAYLDMNCEPDDEVSAKVFKFLNKVEYFEIDEENDKDVQTYTLHFLIGDKTYKLSVARSLSSLDWYEDKSIVNMELHARIIHELYKYIKKEEIL